MVRSPEIERTTIRTTLHFIATEFDNVLTVRDFLPDRFIRAERITALIDIAEIDRIADPKRTGIRLFLPGDHPEQRRFTGTVRADDTDDRAGRNLEVEIFDQ